jgi:hypothetical protein
MAGDRLADYGLLPATGVGVQIDLTAVTRRAGDLLVDGYLCDHNCTITHRGRPTGGHYNCPAAFTRNRGAIAATIAPAEVLLAGIDHVVAAAHLEQERFVAEEFGGYATKFRLGDDVAAVLRRCMLAPTAEVALFGGSPEAHPAVLDVIGGLRAAGHAVHITMTGRKVVREPAFLEALAGSGVDVLALSLDDVDSAEELRRLLELDPDRLYAEWRRVPAVHGQRQKVYEALYTARRLYELASAGRPGLLLNIAVHAGNVSTMDSLLATLAAAFPGVALNPFPIQAGFEQRHLTTNESYAESLHAFVRATIEAQHRRVRAEPARWAPVPRMHYWLALRAALEVDPAEAVDRSAGWDTWRCFRSPGAGRYVQVAGSGRVVTRIGPAGGRVGCFWNDSLADDSVPAVWDAPVDRLVGYLRARPALAAAAARPCAGCLFPRLVGDLVSLETGLDPALHSRYLALRREHLGF